MAADDRSPSANLEERLRREQEARAAAEALVDEKGRELQAAQDAFAERNRELKEREFELELATAQLEKLNDHLFESIEKLKQAQDELVRTERLASLGRLVAGVAHEINTPLGVAVTGASLAGDRVGQLIALFESNQLKRGDLRDGLTEVREATGLVQANLERAAALVFHFKQVAVDRTSQERRRVPLGSYVREVMESLRPMLRSTRIAVEVVVDEDLECDTFPGAISQVVTNLISNSVTHAFEPGQGGRVVLRVGRSGEKGHALLSYEDDGRGMPPEIASRIFEPFFTTRRSAGGSGLGLHIVHNLVTGLLGGRIQVQSAPGAGTVFDLRLPIDGPAPRPA